MNAETSLTFVRQIAAPPERIYEAWLSPAQVAQWWSPDDGPVTSVDIDARVGGVFRVTFLGLDGSEHISEGVFRTLQPYSEIAFSMKSMSDPNITTDVTAMFRATDHGTELTVTQRRFVSTADRDFHAEGWNSALAKLQRVFAAQDEPMRDAKQSVRSLLEEWAASVRAKNMSGVIAHHSGSVRLFNVPEPIEQRGLRQYEKALQLYFDNAPTPAPYDIDALEIQAAGDLAFASMILHCHGGARSEADHLTVRLTVCLEKTADGWSIVHEHHSVAAKLDAMKARS
jgi:ketosteroid isomerase-like protein/uncharacterized protein YndB with AHSA1/START domain